MPTPRQLDHELQTLRSLLLEMADVVDEQYADAVNALFQCDVELAEQVIQRDDEIDALELKVDHQCERILALQQPVAVDLRMIIMAVKINTDLERIGDHCKNLAKNTRHIAHAPRVLAATRLREMAKASRSMLWEAQDAFLKQDRLLARKVLAHDLTVDRIHKENFNALVSYGKEHPEDMEAVAHLITVSKALERISDHTKNIAEGVVFLVEAIDIRHRKLRQPQNGNNSDDRAGS